MIAKILNYFDIGMPNLTYKSPGLSQEFSHHTLINMNYFWDTNRQVYYIRLSKHGMKVYTFDDHVKCGDDAAKACMDDEQPIRVQHDVTEGGVIMHDVPHGDDNGDGFGIGYVNIASIMSMLQKMQMRQDERYAKECRWRETFEVAQMNQFYLMQQHMSTQDSNFKVFTSYVIKYLVSLLTYMNDNHAAVLASINHVISPQ